MRRVRLRSKRVDLWSLFKVEDLVENVAFDHVVRMTHIHLPSEFATVNSLEPSGSSVRGEFAQRAHHNQPQGLSTVTWHTALSTTTTTLLGTHKVSGDRAHEVSGRTFTGIEVSFLIRRESSIKVGIVHCPPFG